MRLECKRLGRIGRIYFAAGLAVLAAPSARAALYLCPGREGGPGLVRDRPAPGCERLLAADGTGSRVEPVFVTPDYSRPLSPPAALREKLSLPLRAQLQREALAAGVPEDLVYLLIEQESRYNPLAVSARGALGLMQLMPDTARALGVGNPWDPSQNLRGGIRYLGRLISRFSGRLPLAVAAYNCGPLAVEKAGLRVPKIFETRQYVTQIFRTYDGGSTLSEALSFMPGESGSGWGGSVTGRGGVRVIGMAPPTTVKGVSLSTASSPAGGPGGAVMYRWLDEAGHEHITNYKPRTGKVVEIIKP